MLSPWPLLTPVCRMCLERKTQLYCTSLSRVLQILDVEKTGKKESLYQKELFPNKRNILLIVHDEICIFSQFHINET